MYSAASSPLREDSQGGGQGKRPSKKWTPVEQDHLVAAIAFQGPAGRERINWAEVAKGLPGRTGASSMEELSQGLALSGTGWLSLALACICKQHVPLWAMQI